VLATDDDSVRAPIVATFISLIVNPKDVGLVVGGVNETVFATMSKPDEYAPLLAFVKVDNPLSMGAEDIFSPHPCSNPCVEKYGPIDRPPVMT